VTRNAGATRRRFCFGYSPRPKTRVQLAEIIGSSNVYRGDSVTPFVDGNRSTTHEIVDANAVKVLLGTPTQNGLVDGKIGIGHMSLDLRL